MMQSEEVADIWEDITGPNKLDRDRGCQHLSSLLKENPDIKTTFNDLILSNAFNPELPWQSKLGILAASTILCHDNEDILKLAPKAIEWLSDHEVRVRMSSGEFLGALCQALGPKVFEEYREKVYALINENLLREYESKPVNSGRRSPIAEEIFHDTAGWRNLESSVKCLQAMINGCAEHFSPFIDQNLLDLIFDSLRHQNRFVRETGYQTIATIIEVCAKIPDQEINPMRNRKYNYHVASQLAKGLADNWSQVRMAASVATRQFLLLFKTYPDAEESVQDLLPRLCLNRYYLAEGVRIYSQDTWVMVVGQGGKKAVEDNLVTYVKYYVECTKADNHAVREAACQCIAELAAKVDTSFVNPWVDLLLNTLIECFQDESWPVRDMACVACGSFIASFPDRSKAKFEPVLKPLFLANLKDSISSVRQGAAQALAKAVKAFEDKDLLTELEVAMKEAFDNVQNQPQESHRYGDLSSKPGDFGVVKSLRDNDPRLHENQTMYSCGSLAPKMKKSSGGCGDCTFRKPSEPWEAADGCLYLACELSTAFPEMVSGLLPKMAEAMRHRHYTLHFHLLETMAKLLPVLGKNMGKRYFKPHLERFFDALFYACESDNSPAASVASQDCLKNLAEFLGVNILKGRVEQYNPNYSMLLNQVLQTPASVMTMPTSVFGAANASSPMTIPRPKQQLGGTPTGSPK